MDQYLKEEIGFNETGATRIKQLMGKGLIDITIIHAIHSTNMSQEQKHQLIQKYEYKAIYAQAGKERNDINVEYDMDDLSKASLWDRFLKREVNLDEKEKIFKNAVKAEKCKMGKIKGKYRPSLRERFLNRITGKQPLAFPTNKEEENHTNTKSKKVTEFKKQINEKAKERTGENTRGKEKQFKNANKNLANLMTSVHSDNQENSKEEGQKDGSAR